MSLAPPFRQVLSERTVEVLVGAALPRVVGRRKVEEHVCRLLDLRVVVKLGAVVGGDGLEAILVAANQRRHTARHPSGTAIRQLPDHRVARLPLDQRHHTVLHSARNHRVDLPMAHAPTGLHGCRSFRNVALPRESPSAVVAVVTLPSELRRLAKASVQISSLELVLPDVAVDGLVADPQPTLPL